MTESHHQQYEVAFKGIDAPFAFVDLDALRSNSDEMLGRAREKRIRVASKSVRCRALLERILASDEQLRGLMTFTLPETLWLAGHGFDDLLLAYPTVDRSGLRELAALESETAPIVVVDSTEQLDLIEATVRGGGGARIRVCIDLDAAWWAFGDRVKVGPRRSPVHSPRQAASLAEEIVRRPTFELCALMAYEGHIAGVGDEPPGRRLRGALIRRMQHASVAELAERRAATVEAVRAIAPITVVNGGGTGSLHTTSAESAITEVTAGSGFYAPTLFDSYSAFRLTPAAYFALPVVRKPSPGVATVLGGGYIASGAAGADRLPTPSLPPGLELDSLEGAGEVQTPVRGAAAEALAVGDNVYFRHAKAGELCERFDSVYLVEGERIVEEAPTYRGEGRCFL